MVACEVTMRLAVVDVGHLVAAVNLTVVSQKRWQPPRRASDALTLLNAQSGTLCCVKRRSAFKVLGRIVRRADGLLKRVR